MFPLVLTVLIVPLIRVPVKACYSISLNIPSLGFRDLGLRILGSMLLFVRGRGEVRGF